MGKPKIRFKGYEDDWEQRKLNEVAGKICVGFVGTCEKFYTDESGIPMYRTGNLNGLSLNRDDLKYVTNEFHQHNQKSQLKAGDILIARHGDSGKAVNYENSEEANCLNIVIIRPDFKKCNYKFLTNCINSPECQKHIKSLSAGSTQAVINTSEIEKLGVVIPANIDEQNRIARYFFTLDHLITLHQRKCEETKSLKKYMLQKMFPENGNCVPKIRFSGFADDWEQRKLGEMIKEYKETVDSDCILPVLTSSKTEGVILQEEHFGRKQQHDITGYNILPRNYCTYRNRSDGVDFTFNINKCCDKGIISKFYPVFSGNNSDVFFISLLLNNSDEIVQEIAYTCTGTGQKVLSFLDLQKMKVRVPSYDEQKEIAAYFENLDHLITLHQRKVSSRLFLNKSTIFREN